MAQQTLRYNLLIFLQCTTANSPSAWSISLSACVESLDPLRRSTSRESEMPHSGRPAAGKFGHPDGFEKMELQTSYICTHTAHPHRSRIHPLTARHAMRSVLSRLSLSPLLPIHCPESPDNDSQRGQLPRLVLSYCPLTGNTANLADEQGQSQKDATLWVPVHTHKRTYTHGFACLLFEAKKKGHCALCPVPPPVGTVSRCCSVRVWAT